MSPRRPPPPFQPRAHDRVGLERPVTKGMRVLPQADLERIHRVNVSNEERWSWRSPAHRARVRRYAIGATVALWIVNWLFLPRAYLSLAVEIPVYALYGAAIAIRRPGQIEAAALTVLAGVMALLFSGVTRPTLFVLLAGVAWLLIGAVVGVDEEAKISLGQDP